MEFTAQLNLNGKTLPLSPAIPTEGHQGIDIGKLRESADLLMFDRGFANTAACRSGITFLDGEKGILRYRGYDIEELDLDGKNEKELRKILQDKELVYVEGGNTFYLRTYAFDIG